jgi:Fe-S-cluster-containing hydrogenase component 2
MHLRAESSKCTGCRLCQLACSLANFHENNPKKSCLAIDPRFPAPGVFEVRTCTQCGECADVCPERCIVQNEKGAYYIKAEECSGCLDCVEVCPEGVVFTHADQTAPFQCILCGECVHFCPYGALQIA